MDILQSKEMALCKDTSCLFLWIFHKSSASGSAGGICVMDDNGAMAYGCPGTLGLTT